MRMESLDRLEEVVGRIVQKMGSLREENRGLNQEIHKLKGANPRQNKEALDRLKGVIEKLESFSITKQ